MRSVEMGRIELPSNKFLEKICLQACLIYDLAYIVEIRKIDVVASSM